RGKHRLDAQLPEARHRERRVAQVRLVELPRSGATDDGEQGVHQIVEVAAVRVEQHRDDRPSSSPGDADAEVEGRARLAAPIAPESIQLGGLAPRASNRLQKKSGTKQAEGAWRWALT